MESQPRTSGGAEGKSSDDIVYELADTVINSILTFISTEDANIHMFKVRTNFQHYKNVIHSHFKFQRDDKGRLPSLTTVLVQEVDRYNKLLKLIHNSMKDLKKAIKGLVVMSEALEDVFKAFINNQVRVYILLLLKDLFTD